MKKHFSLLIIGVLCGLFATAQDYGFQVPNSDFEADWVTYKGAGKNSKSASEPKGWHAFGSAWTSSILTNNAVNTEQIQNSYDVRPGSKGSKSTKLKAKQINLGVTKITANGSLTTGRMNCGSASASDDANHIYTDRGADGFNVPFSGQIPDSITVWLCYYTNNDSNEAAFHTVIHGDANLVLYGNGKEPDLSQLAYDADYNYTRTTTSSDNLIWKRMSVPFIAKGTCTTPKFILVTMSTNRVPASGSSSDFVLVDDIVLIYNPTLATGSIAKPNLDGEVGKEINVKIPFTLTGSMSVSNLNAAPNQVIAQLSDENGSFANPVEIGRLTTNKSGEIDAAIPASVGNGTYKVRVVSTNYPMIAEPSNDQITIRRYYAINIAEVASEIGTVQGAAHYFIDEDCNATISATPAQGYQFLYWRENGGTVSTDQVYSFTADKSHNFEAVFGKVFSISIATEGYGKVVDEQNNEIETLQVAETQGVKLIATPDESYKFLKWTDENGELVSESATLMFPASQDVSLVAHFARFVTISASTNIENAASISGTGNYVTHNDEEVDVTLLAVSNNSDLFTFVNWTENGEEVCRTAEYKFKTTTNRTLIANYLARFEINAVAANEDYGNVFGSDFYNNGQKVTVLAVPAENCRFVEWQENEVAVYNQPSFSFTATENRNLTAIFAKQFIINAETNLEEAGTISGAGKYDENAEITLSCTPNEGFTFEKWTVNGVEVSAEPTYKFNATQSMNILANLAVIPVHEIIADADPQIGGTASGSGKYYRGSEITLTAVANEGYEFVAWKSFNGDVLSKNKTYTFTATADLNKTTSIFAVFSQMYIEGGKTVKLTATEGGSVMGSGFYAGGSTISILATPNPNFTFVNWTDDNGDVVSTDEKYAITLTDNVSLTANFQSTLQNFNVELLANETEGTISGSNTYKEQSQVTAVATPAKGYRFVRWTENGETVSTSTEYTFVCTKDRILNAEFEKLITITIADFEGAELIGFTDGIYTQGETVTLTLKLDERYRFIAWKNATAPEGEYLSTSLVYSFTATEDVELQILVKERGKMVTVAVSLGGTISGLNNGLFETGEQVTLLATPKQGFLFNGWFRNGEIMSTDPILTFFAAETIDIYALFSPEPQPITVDVEINNDEFGTVLGAGEYFQGDEIMLIATPTAGYEFIGWYKGDKMLSNLSTLYTTVNTDCTIKAEFKLIEQVIDDITDVYYQISVFPNPAHSILNVQANQIIESLQITTITGTKVFEELVNDSQTSIDVQNFKAGMYVVILNFANSSEHEFVIVK